MTKELDVEKVRVGMVQGDLYFLEPMSGFQALPAGSARNYNIVVSLWAVQRTDSCPFGTSRQTNVTVQQRVCDPLCHLTSSTSLISMTSGQWKRWRGDRTIRSHHRRAGRTTGVR
ncbi:hypothetical protein DPMN_030322 [Dreissena polymorpha]|uniref:N-acetyl-beta-glucosaminidase n=1 Tax=Dreissena polymorpha TaxID=45954 RepID=A0A9D4RHY9_DREPO|nr:hypothetical protein DPMN_030322 [Dreissena polymorpha]